jgi:hypothetical protein
LILPRNPRTILPSRFYTILKGQKEKADTGELSGEEAKKGLQSLNRVLEVSTIKQQILELAKSEAGLAGSPEFSIDASERSHALELCGQLKELISASIQIKEDHKIRLMKRVSAIKVELYSTA